MPRRTFSVVTVHAAQSSGDDGFRVSTSGDGVALNVVVEGEFDLGARTHWEAAVLPLLTPPCPQLLDVDLGGVDFFDSSGLGLLVELRQWSEPNGVRLRLLNPPRNVVCVLEFAGVSGLFEMSAAQLEPD